MTTVAAAVYGLAGMLCSAGCNPTQAAAPTEPGSPKPTIPTGPTVPPRPPTTRPNQPTPSRIKPVIFDPYATRFAVVTLDDKDKGDKYREKDRCGFRQDDPGWEVMAPPSATDGKKPDPHAPREPGVGISRFCVYKWRNDKTLPNRDDFRRIGAVPDNAIIGTGPATSRHTLKAGLPEKVSKPLLDIFTKQANGIESGLWKRLFDSRREPKKGIRVALVDATPKGLGSPDNSYHGYATGRVIGTLLCGGAIDGACGQQVRPYLALPLVGPAVEDRVNGGYSGTTFHLVEALSRALREWDPAKDNLVINLSLGWDPIKLDAGNPNQARIVALLERASCMGALIVAAAGNPTGVDGAVYPGAFEQYQAPDAKRCADFKLPAGSSPSSKGYGRYNSKPYVPLLHAVGALDAADQRLMADRRWAQPRLGALGMNVTVPGPPGKERTSPLSGTSMSTAIVSGIAAAVWSLRPELDAADVMSFVYDGGVALDGGEKSKRARSEFCMEEQYGACDGRNSKTHRAYLCGAVAEALKHARPGSKLADLRPTVVCDPGHWPKDPKWDDAIIVNGKVIEPCRVPGCGIPFGPMSNQVVSEVVPHGGAATCPGCTLDVSTVGMGTLRGVPRPPEANTEPVGYSAILTVLDDVGEASYFINPPPTFDERMTVTNMQMSVTVSGAILTYCFELAGACHPHPPIGLHVINWSY